MRKKLEYNATLVERHDLSPQLAVFVVEPDEPKLSSVAGQYTVLGLKACEPCVPGADCEPKPGREPDAMLRRPYSICSSVHVPERLEFYVNIVTSGELTPRLFNLEPGGRLYVGDFARGLLTLDAVPPECNILMVATGTGLGPYVSMFRSHLRDFPERRLGIIHGARYSWDLGYRNELERYARQYAGVTYVPVVSRPRQDKDWKGRTGRVQQWLEPGKVERQFGFALDPGETHVFLCGNPDMVKDAIELLADRGFTEHSHKEPGTVHAEKYW